MLNGRVLNRRVRAAAPLLLLGSLAGALACGPELSPTTSEGAGSTESEGSEGGSTDVDTTSAGAGTSSGTSAGLTDGLTGGPTEASTAVPPRSMSPTSAGVLPKPTTLKSP